ncbi:carboxyl transferase domain-containing protein [Umezawaea sp. NPDC059074]|uniref:carboxyl transferase domain-containing protein n=1 Tax=Umezawaea sp. NPDC059074 TaxID=3346716 RepID=UPI003690D407
MGANPLGWAGYGAQLGRARSVTGGDEAVSWERRGDAVAISFDFRFLGGSVGTATGDLIEEAFAEAGSEGLPVVSVIATGGSRMQEGMASLRQLQRISHLCARHAEVGLPHVSVLCDPTTGGIWASLGAGADVVLAVPGAQVGFAGSRVRPGPDPAYTSEGQFDAGAVDLVVEPAELGGVLGALLPLLMGGDLRPASVPRALGLTDLPADGWAAVERARAAERPRAAAYLDDYFTARVPFSGDRAGGVDPGMLCGIGLHEGRSVVYAAQTGTANTPAGFRTASRVVRLADRLGLPVLTLVDTPGAANDAAAERAGVGPAIAGLFATMATARVPVTTLVIGEGGSGGALALASPDQTWIAPDAYFSVIAPELAAAILKRDPAQVAATADQLKLRPQDLVDLGIVRGIAGP